LVRWGSAAAHLRGGDDSLAKVKPLLDLVDNWNGLLEDKVPDGQTEELGQHEQTGRPLGDERFLRKLEKRTARVRCPRKPGPKPRRKTT
jgi:putative transposase